MSETLLDPFAAEFKPDIDPIKADQTALMILDKLDEARYLRRDALKNGGDAESLATVEKDLGGLKKSMASYLGYKKARREEPLSHEPEAIARKRFKSEEEYARQITKLYQADDTTFNAFLKENGDEEDYKQMEAFMPEGVSMRERYITKKAMAMLGFSEREIDSGFAEPQFRKFLNAGEHEPTIDAIPRWGLDKVNQYDRKHKIAKEANDAAVNSYLGMSDSEVKFEETLAKANPGLSDTERTMIRAIRNNVRDEMEKGAGHIRPIIKKTFNTIAKQEGTPTKFGDEAYPDLNAAMTDLTNLPEKDFPQVVAMLAATAEQHGQDVPGFMARVGKNFNRAAESRIAGGLDSYSRRRLENAEKIIKEAKARGETPMIAYEDSSKTIADPGYEALRWLNDPSNQIVKPGTAPLRDFLGVRPMNTEEVAAVEGIIAQHKKQITFAGHLRDWKGAVAKVQSGSPWHPSQWAYTVAGSLPEMAAAATGVPGLALIYSSQVEKNMVDFQKQYPSMDVERVRSAAETGAAFYTIASKLELDILFKKIPGIKNVWGQAVGKLALETVQETGQDLSFPIARAAFEAVDESMPDVNLFGEDGELMKAIEQAPKTAFAVLPLVALGMGGMKAASYMDQRALKKLLNNGELLAQYGVSQEEIAAMSEMSLEDAVKFLEGKNYSFSDPQQTDTFQQDFSEPTGTPDAMGEPAASSPGFSVSYDGETGNFTVSNGVGALTARTPLEVAEAARTLDPTPFLPQSTSTGQTSTVALTEANAAALDAHAAAALAHPAPESLAASTGTTGFGNPLRWNLETDNRLVDNPTMAHPELTAGALDVLRAIGSRSPVRFSGRRVPKTARGVYWLKARMIRVRRNDGVTTVFHEVGHAIEDQFLEGGIGDAKWVKVRNASPALAQELDRLGNALYQGTAPAGTTMSEGFAEYMRMLFEGVHDMDVAAPETHRWFTENILKQNPHIAAAIEALQKKSVVYAMQGSLNRARASIIRAPGTIQKSRVAVESIFANADREWIDALFPLRDFNRAAQMEVSYELEPLEQLAAKGKATKAQLQRITELKALQATDPFETATSLSLVHDAIVKYMVEEQMRDWQGNNLGPGTSLKDILAPFHSDDARQNLAIYLWAKRTLAFQNDPRKGTKGRTFETGLRVEDAIKIFNELDSPLMERTAQKLYEWNNNVLEYAANSSEDFRVVVDKIRAIDPGCYIPLFREFDNFNKNYQNTTPSATTGKLIRGIKGSTRRIKDPFASMISQAREIVLRSHQRAVLEQLLNLGNKVNGLGDMIFQVQPDRIPAAHRNIAQTLDALTRALEDPDSLGAAGELAKVLEETGEGDRLITFWGEAYMPPNALENPIIPIYIDGQRKWFEVNRTMYDAIMGMEVFRFPGAMGKVFDLTVGATNRMFKLGTTGYRASFSMVTNPLRDFSTLYHNTRSTAKAPELAAVWGQTLLQGFLSAISGRVVGDTQWHKLYRRMGLEMASRLGQDTKHTEASARRLFQSKTMRVVHPYNILEYIREVFQYAEAGARVAEMKLVAKDIGWDVSQPLTREVATKLAIAAKQVTTDFTAAGRQMRWINQIMPFSNAQIQGVRAHYDAHNRNPVVFWMKGMAKAALSVSLWMQYKDEEWWVQMPIGEKYRYSYIPDPFRENEIIRIPRSFEVDGFFMAMPVAVLDAWNLQDPKRATEWAKHFITSMAPTTMPVLLSTPVEMGMNRDIFFDRPIVPKWEVEKYNHPDWKHLQYGSHTTKLAIELGDMFGVSPRMIDHGIKKFTGGAGMDAVAMFGRGPAGTGDSEREWVPADIPVIGTLWSPVGKGSFEPRSITALYDRLDWAIGHEQSLKVMDKKESKEEERMRLILRDATATMSALSEVSKLELKTEERRKIEALKVHIAKEAVEVFDSKEGTRSKFLKWKNQAESLEKQRVKAAKNPGIPEEE